MRLARIILFSLARAVASSKDSPRAALLKLAGQVDDAPARGGDDEFADAARADASAPAKDSPESPPRRSLLSYLTGRREDAAGAPADDGSPKQNNTSARLMFDFTKDYFDDLSLFLSLANETKLRESEKAVTAICFPPGLYYGSWDERNLARDTPWVNVLSVLMFLVFVLRTALNVYFFVSTLRYAAANWRAILERVRTAPLGAVL